MQTVNLPVEGHTLGDGWEGGYCGHLLDDLMQKTPWIADFRTPTSGKLSHTVVVDGINELEQFTIRDPWEATRYEMTPTEFHRVWTGIAVFNELEEKL